MQVSCYGKRVQVAPCRRCTGKFEQPGTSTWWGKGRYTYMNGKTTDKEPPAPPGQPPSWQPWQPEGADSEEEEEKLDEKLNAKPVPLMPLGPAAASSCAAGGSAASSSSATPIVMDLTGDD